MLVDLLVELGDRARAHSRAPQRLGHVLDPAHRHSRQIHLHNRFLDRDLSPPIAIDNRCLKCLTTQLRHLQLNLAGLRRELPPVVSGPCVHSVRRALITLGSTHLIGLSVQQTVQRLLNCAANHLVQMPAYLPLVNPYHAAQRLRGIVVHGGLS